MENFHIKHNLSVTAHHASNGKVERYIRTLQDYLRTTIDANDDWIAMIPLAEFTINSNPSIALGGSSPFQVDLGYSPPSSLNYSYQLSEERRDADNITEILDRYAICASATLEFR
jgi:hypothetical protein